MSNSKAPLPVLVPGTKVFHKPRIQYFNDDTCEGIVVELVRDKRDTYLIEWKALQPNLKPSRTQVHKKNLLTESEFSEFELEFKNLSKEINDKLTDAAKLIGEASDLARKHGAELSEMYDAIQPLMDTMENMGWNTSSMNC